MNDPTSAAVQAAFQEMQRQRNELQEKVNILRSRISHLVGYYGFDAAESTAELVAELRDLLESTR